MRVKFRLLELCINVKKNITSQVYSCRIARKIVLTEFRTIVSEVASFHREIKNVIRGPVAIKLDRRRFQMSSIPCLTEHNLTIYLLFNES